MSTPIPERLEGRATGQVFSAWIDATVLDAAPVYDHTLRDCDSLHRRAQVAAQVTVAGATIPQPAPEPVREAAFTVSELAEDYQLVPLKDPVYLRTEDVQAAGASNGTANPELLLDRAITSLVEQEETATEPSECERLAVLRGWCEETLIWYTALPLTERPVGVVALRKLDGKTPEPVRTPTGKVRTHKGQPVTREVAALVGYCLVVEVPTVLLPWQRQRLAAQFRWPTSASDETDKRAARVVA